jgi:transcriptional activator of cad operon
MEKTPTTELRTGDWRIGDWRVCPKSGEISRNGETFKLEVRTMRLLVCLAERAGEVVSIEDLLNHVWSDVFVSQDSVYQAVATLRRLLGDDPKRPKYIVTVPRLGYRMVAQAGPWVEQPDAAASRTSKQGDRRAKSSFLWAVAAIVFVSVAGLVIRGKIAGHPASASNAVAASQEKSIAVLPFLDLTEGMKEEEFADGMTEELIDKLSKIPGMRVPPPTSSFFYKNKQVPVREVAKSLGVTYVLDGSTRKSGNRLRVAARLVRADTAYVLWSETYDRPWDDVLKIQDDIAGEVAKALKASIATLPRPES